MAKLRFQIAAGSARERATGIGERREGAAAQEHIRLYEGDAKLLTDSLERIR